MASDIPRLSDLNISDPIIRAAFYQEIKRYIDDVNNEVVSYDLKEDEEYRADLVSQRAFNLSELDWLVYLVCEVDDPAESLPVGETIYFPPATWIRRTMRQFIDAVSVV